MVALGVKHRTPALIEASVSEMSASLSPPLREEEEGKEERRKKVRRGTREGEVEKEQEEAGGQGGGCFWESLVRGISIDSSPRLAVKRTRPHRVGIPSQQARGGLCAREPVGRAGAAI